MSYARFKQNFSPLRLPYLWPPLERPASIRGPDCCSTISAVRKEIVRESVFPALHPLWWDGPPRPRRSDSPSAGLNLRFTFRLTLRWILRLTSYRRGECVAYASRPWAPRYFGWGAGACASPTRNTNRQKTPLAPPQHTYPQTSGAPQAKGCVTRRRAPRMAVGSRPRIGAIRSSFCARLTKAASPN